MLTLRSILQQICQFFRGMSFKVTKRMYRSSAVFMAGAAIITVVAFTSAGFGSGGRNALTAFAETPESEDSTDKEDVKDETAKEETVTQEKAQIKLTEVRMQAQQLAGDFLEKDVIQKQEQAEESKAEIERINTKIAMEEEAKRQAEEAAEEAKKAAEEAAKKAEKEKAAHSTSVNQDDYQVLLKIVQAEAGICDDKGKILVANVIINRVKSGKFPDTVKGVVYEPSQFSPVSNGSINSVKVTDDTKQCVDRALAGEDYSDGALYFMYRGGSRRGAISWFDSHLTYLFQHGNHEFFK
ncbi:cell wall hydrolase [Lacrimispora sphenoides]|uniref:N-acetylmuramoyl-L-alanine amidase n=1 Tax=Lacrimispora sphenoides JCM 1415 TaxID=1297793 RepID=A0ABY1C7D1_9FIRM|nr:cell wall hydrolase [Lacrimispora sphenoides]SET76989.1 N-acetylmuramoyl-L-alanine amidase [[Clostridium] sphenoides JCM 1415]SUY51128.1 cell wall hydrolase SleB [Lacrimispora sphenoides]